MIAEKFFTPNIPKLEIVNVPPWWKKKQKKVAVSCASIRRQHILKDFLLHLELVRLQLSLSGFGSET